MSQEGSSRNRTAFLLAAVVAFIAISSNYIFFAGVETPPSDFGSGQMFDLIASRYDMINRVLAMRMDIGWRKTMVETVAARVSNIGKPKLLDIATGTADVALMLSKEIPDGTVLGLDPSQKMLDVGIQKVKDQHLEGKINLQWADARDFSGIEESTFDGATMAFGIRNVPEKEVALCEIHRVLKPGSVFCVLEFSEPQSAGFLNVAAKFFIRHIVPILGGVLSGAPREYLHLQNSIKDFPSPKEFGSLMENLNCGSDRRRSFQMDNLLQMNFDSVQLYVTTRL
mmetsp:Transcript_25478/g.35869  ORF Transcript_25478/g.35869 Transcript_25478/m.35869 type:complete len:283 (+) Transcript_25478:106-954(+)